MRVAKLTRPNTLEVVEEAFKQEPAKGQVVVKVQDVGICGTDLHIFRGERADVQLPRVMGHELSGVVTQIGEDVETLKVGDRVVLDPVVSCGKCHMCTTGHPNVCRDVKCYGVQADGGYKDYIVVDANKLYVFPEKYSFVEAALAEPFSIAANILERAALQKGENVVIIGSGTIGLCTAQAAKGLGARVLITDVVDSKLELAKQNECDCVINSTREDLAQAVTTFASDGVDVIIDCVGIAPLLKQCLNLATPLTRIVVIGFDGKEAGIAPVEITKRELTLVGSRMNALKFSTVIQWLEDGIIKPACMVTRVFPIEQIQEAFEFALSHPETIKTVISFEK